MRYDLPTLRAVRRWIARDAELARESIERDNLVPDARRLEEQREQTFKAQLADIDAIIAKTKTAGKKR